MSDPKSVSLAAGGKNVELPVLTGSLGPACVDIGKIGRAHV